MKLHNLLILSILTLFVQVSIAAQIQKVKGKNTLIELEGLSVSPGDLVEAFDADTQKKTAILRISKVKAGKAIAKMIRGRAKVKQQVQLRRKKSAAMPTSRSKNSTSRSSKSSSNSTFAVGGLFGVGFDTMEINIGTPAETITQTGMGFSLMGAGDYRLTDWFSIRALAGVEQFNVKADSTLGTAPCDTCETEITYFSAVGWARFHVQSFWLGAGLGLQHPLSTTTNALDEASVSTSVVYAFGGGADIAFGKDMYIPVHLEYGTQPESESGDVSSSYYGVRIGLMLRY